MMGKRKKSIDSKPSTSKHCDENDSFIDISTLSGGSNFNTSLNIVTHEGYDNRKSDLDDPIETLPSPSKFIENSTLCGISSFQRFIMSTSNSVAIGNTAIKEPTSSTCLTKAEVVSESFASEDEGGSLPFLVSCPNILKHKRKDQKHLLQSTSPIKTLTFSPSRFLNVEKDDKGVHINSDLSRDLSFSNISFDAEDSGIGGSDVDPVDYLSPPSLTSTPCTRSRRKASLQSISHFISPPDEKNMFSSATLSTLSEATEEANPTKTPLIKKFLNESAPRTPTPFKCPGITADKNSTDFLVFESRNNTKSNICSPFANDESCFKRPSPVTSRIRLKDTISKSVNKKTARKALILDHDYNFKRKLFIKDQSRANDVKLDPLNKSFRLSHCDQSSLIEDSTVIEKRNICSRGKSVYMTRRASAHEKARHLDKTWVSVACGRSVNQKVMTEAAKRCLRQRCNVNSTSYEY